MMDIEEIELTEQMKEVMKRNEALSAGQRERKSAIGGLKKHWYKIRKLGANFENAYAEVRYFSSKYIPS
jgi:hypothetical protein